MRKAVMIVLLLLALTGYALWRHHRASHEDTMPKKLPTLVRVATAAAKDVPLAIGAVGTVVPYQTVAIRARLDSQIMEVKFHSGDYVNQGDLLFQLDDRAIKARIAEQESNVARDKAQEENLRLQYERAKELAGKGFSTQETLDTAKATYDAQAATTAATAAALQNLQVQLQYTQITAPISGRTGTVSLTAGNTVKANDTSSLVTINQVRPIWAQVSLPQKYLDSIRDAKAAGEVPAAARHESGKTVSGHLDYIDNAVDDSTGTFAARVLFDNGDESLWPGMFVNVTLTLGAENQVLTVPEVAIQRGQDSDYVFVVNDNKAERRTVKVRRMEEGDAVIDSGLKAGEQVSTDGMMKLDDGAAVNIVPADAAEKTR